MLGQTKRTTWRSLSESEGETKGLVISRDHIIKKGEE
jgi:hypothetical protein